MTQDGCRNESSENEAGCRSGQMSRRNLLVITAKSIVGLTALPLCSVLAGQAHGSGAVNVMMSELFEGVLPVGLSLGGSATSAVSALRALGDINGDGIVDEEDLRIMASEWLTSAASAISNLDGSFSYIGDSAGSEIYVDQKDYALLANDWGKTSAMSAIGRIDFGRSVRGGFASSMRRRLSKSKRV